MKFLDAPKGRAIFVGRNGSFVYYIAPFYFTQEYLEFIFDPPGRQQAWESHPEYSVHWYLKIVRYVSNTLTEMVKL